MRFSWLTVSIVISLSCIASAQNQAAPAKSTPLQRLFAPQAGTTALVGGKDNQITSVLPFDEYDSVANRIRNIVVAQRELMKNIDAAQHVTSISSEQAQMNYLKKLEFLKGMKQQIENAYRVIDPRQTSEISATKVVADDYLGYLAPIFSVAESANPHFINDCAELQRIGMTQHFTLNGKDAVVVFRGDKVFNTLVSILCPKYSN